jgi:hypothetical protein
MILIFAFGGSFFSFIHAIYAFSNILSFSFLIQFQMSEHRIDEYLPTQGLLYFDEQLKYVISKPKIMPLKSLTLEKV